LLRGAQVPEPQFEIGVPQPVVEILDVAELLGEDQAEFAAVHPGE
jgi:hypothetical protein